MVQTALSEIETQFPVIPMVPDDQQKENMLSALGRKLPRAGIFKTHDRVLSVAAGGPSLADTWGEMRGTDIAAVNGSLDYLIGQDCHPWACGVLDPGAHMAGIVSPHRGVIYFVASVCHPSVFDRLEGCDVVLWHPSGMEGAQEIVAEHDGAQELLIGGGSTMGLRWVNLAYCMGYRNFHLHGLDSSFRQGLTHAYPDRRDHGEFMSIEGFQTRRNFIAQIADFFGMIERFGQPDIDPVKFTVHGDGLLQNYWQKHKETNRHDTQ